MTEPIAIRRNIALTGPAEFAKDFVMTRLPFTEGQAVARFGVAYALLRRMSPDRPSDFGRTVGQNMAVLGFDPTQEIGALLRALFPDRDDPYVVAETLMSLGLIRLREDLESGLVSSIADICELSGADGAPN